MKLEITLVFLCLFGMLTVYAGDPGADLPPLSIKKATGKIRLDGVLDEADWSTSEVATGFRQYFPFDTSFAQAQTEVRVTYDDEFIYIGAKMYNATAEREYVTPSLRRDFRGEANDGITVVIDPFQDRTNAFQFGVNPFGVQREGLVANGGSTSNDLSLNWDNRWFSDARQYSGYWVAEIAIPFTTLRFREGSELWNINFYRIDSELGERSSWSPIPRNFPIITLAFLRELKWDQPLRKPGANLAIIPYGLASTSEDFREAGQGRSRLNAGADAKVGLGPSLNLDLTFNPDFSQVEVDQQVTNLDRFEIFFPERRQFFLENADLFADFGQDRLRPFFSRRIGVVRDPGTGQTDQNTIYYGARLSGRLDRNWRLGLMNMQTASDENLRAPATNYTVAAVQRRVWSRSNLGFLFVNKEPFSNINSSDSLLRNVSWNRVAGMDFNLASKDNKWNGKAYLHHSFDKDGQGKDPFVAAALINYSTLRWSVYLNTQYVGEGYNPEVGFVRRRDFRRAAGVINHFFYPRSRTINRHGPGFDFDVTANETYGVTDYDINLLYNIQFLNTAIFRARLRQEYIFLFDPFDPTNTGGEPLAAGTDFTTYLLVGAFDSDRRKPLSYSLEGRYGGYFNGNRLGLEGELNYRFQPYGSVAMTWSYNRIRLEEPQSDANLLLVGPRFDITFTRSLFWTTFIQYNNQIDNLNINSRLQWRFKPVSDMFLVYTDNYFPSNFRVKTRAVVLKVTYWLNV